MIFTFISQIYRIIKVASPKLFNAVLYVVAKYKTLIPIKLILSYKVWRVFVLEFI